MKKYIFILGNNPELSRAEIAAVLPHAKITAGNAQFLIAESEGIDCQKVINRLGGTIKIGEIIGDKPDFSPILSAAHSAAVKGKFKFGVSFYGVKKNSFGMKAKAILKERGISARLVESRDDALSSVIVTKEKVKDFLVVPDYFGLTEAVQDFRDYSHRDFDRPAADALSGMLPPKAAKMMINLAEQDFSAVILDPFCGSGTVLAEALALGYRRIIGTDLSEKAVSDSRKNLAWLKRELRSGGEIQIEQSDVKRLAEKVGAAKIDAIVTEPFLGQPIRGNERPETIRHIINDLQDLYQSAFEQFSIVLKDGGRLVIVIPEWHLRGETFRLDLERIAAGWRRLDQGGLIYKREDQKVWRNICIFER